MIQHTTNGERRARLVGYANELCPYQKINKEKEKQIIMYLLLIINNTFAFITSLFAMKIQLFSELVCGNKATMVVMPCGCETYRQFDLNLRIVKAIMDFKCLLKVFLSLFF